MLRPLATLATVAALCAGCDDFPRHPRDTSERAVGGTVRVGVGGNPPWTLVAEPPAGVVEVELVRRFAEGIGADVEWRFGAESELLRQLARFDLAIVVAGLTVDTSWKATSPSRCPTSSPTSTATRRRRRSGA